MYLVIVAKLSAAPCENAESSPPCYLRCAHETDPTIDGPFKSTTRLSASAKLEGLFGREGGVGYRLSTRSICSGLRDTFVEEEVKWPAYGRSSRILFDVISFSTLISIQKIDTRRY